MTVVIPIKRAGDSLDLDVPAEAPMLLSTGFRILADSTTPLQATHSNIIHGKQRTIGVTNGLHVAGSDVINDTQTADCDTGNDLQTVSSESDVMKLHSVGSDVTLSSTDSMVCRICQLSENETGCRFLFIVDFCNKSDPCGSRRRFRAVTILRTFRLLTTTQSVSDVPNSSYFRGVIRRARLRVQGHHAAVSSPLSPSVGSPEALHTL